VESIGDCWSTEALNSNKSIAVKRQSLEHIRSPVEGSFPL
jgi:hypothetical protein